MKLTTTNRKSIVKLGIIGLLGIVAILCISSMRSVVRFNQKQIVFDVIYTSASTGSTAGFFIDAGGNVYTFRNDIPRIRLLRSLIEAGRPEDPYSTRDLFKYYGYSNQLVGSIDPRTMDKMTLLIQPASTSVLELDDPLTPPGCTSHDAGIYLYRAFVYISDYKVHLPVKLYVMGDAQAVSSSQEGKTLHQWLETICIENDYFYGCKPSSQICRP